MTNAPTQIVSSYSARKLSFKQLQAWSAAGASHRDKLKEIVKEIIRSLHRTSSPAKAIGTAMQRLESLFAQQEVRGEVHLLNNRHINFRLAFPTTNDEGLVFCLLYGQINARTGAVKFDLTNPIQMSLHALQRLFERLDENSDSAVLDEVYSCIGQVIHWHKGATEIQAKCWPLISKNGFFIGTSEDDSPITTVVTWIKDARNGKKWGLPLRNLAQIKQTHPERLEDYEFAREFIRSFPWMLHEHVPGEDFISLAWEQRAEEEIDEEEDQTYESAYKVEELENEDKAVLKAPFKLSSSYIPGLNYKEIPPPFKTQSFHSGLVVQKRGNGRLIIGLKNGWIGQIPCQSIERGARLIPDFKTPELGDDVNVVVHKITHFPDESAFAISLDTKEVSDANWSVVEKEHPIGTVFNATLHNKFNQEYIAQLSNGIRGFISSIAVKRYLNQPAFYGCSPIGLNLDVIVTGYRSDRKHLLLSIEEVEKTPSVNSNSKLYKPRERTSGICIRCAANFALIELFDGGYGILHKLNNWGLKLPEVGEETQSIVIEANDLHVLLGGIPKQYLERTFFAYPLSEERWENFVSKFTEGESVEVQTLFWRENSFCYMVVTKDGVVGTLPANEVDWFCSTQEKQKTLLKSGDIFIAKILKIHPTKSRVTFSKKAMEQYLLDEQLHRLDHNNPIHGCVVTVMDYGCFVELTPYGIQALLHRTNIPEGKKISKGETLNVYIDTIDKEKRRVAIKLTETTDAPLNK